MTWMIWRSITLWLRKPPCSFWVNCMGSGLVWTCHSSCRWSSQNMWIDISLNVRGFSALGLGASKLHTPDFSHRIGSILVDLGVGSQEVFGKSSRPKIILKKTGANLGKSISPSDLQNTPEGSGTPPWPAMQGQSRWRRWCLFDPHLGYPLDSFHFTAISIKIHREMAFMGIDQHYNN